MRDGGASLECIAERDVKRSGSGFAFSERLDQLRAGWAKHSTGRAHNILDVERFERCTQRCSDPHFTSSTGNRYSRVSSSRTQLSYHLPKGPLPCIYSQRERAWHCEMKLGKGTVERSW
jgi:hypothetical protein